MVEKLFSWLPAPLFSSGVLPLRSDSRIKRQIIIGRSGESEEITCYRVDLEFENQEKTYLLTSRDSESLALCYERALKEAEEEGYIVDAPDRPKPRDIAEVIQAENARDS